MVFTKRSQRFLVEGLGPGSYFAFLSTIFSVTTCAEFPLTPVKMKILPTRFSLRDFGKLWMFMYSMWCVWPLGVSGWLKVHSHVLTIDIFLVCQKRLHPSAPVFKHSLYIHFYKWASETRLARRMWVSESGMLADCYSLHWQKLSNMINYQRWAFRLSVTGRICWWIM